MSRPDGNMTGVAFFVIAMGPKQLEMLLSAVPKAMLIGFLSNPGYRYANTQIDELQAAARSLGRKMVVQPVTNEAEIEPAFTALSKQGIDALIVGGDPFFSGHREQIVAQAAQHALPTCYGWREDAMAGGLMSYGADLIGAYRQVGIYTAAFSKERSLPICRWYRRPTSRVGPQPNTARGLGLSVPPSLLASADEVIE